MKIKSIGGTAMNFKALWELTIALFLIATGYATFLMILMNIFGAKV